MSDGYRFLFFDGVVLKQKEAAKVQKRIILCAYGETWEGKREMPEDPSFYSAECYPVLIGGRLKGATVFPMVKDYPEKEMELIASQNMEKPFP